MPIATTLASLLFLLGCSVEAAPDPPATESELANAAVLANEAAADEAADIAAHGGNAAAADPQRER